MPRDRELERIRYELNLSPKHERWIAPVAGGVFATGVILAQPLTLDMALWGITGAVAIVTVWNVVGYNSDETIWDSAWRRLLAHDGRRALKTYDTIMARTLYPGGRLRAYEPTSPDLARVELEFLQRNAPSGRRLGILGGDGVRMRREFLLSSEARSNRNDPLVSSA